MDIETGTLPSEVPKPTFWHKLLCFFFGHIPVIEIEVRRAEIKVPGEPTRDILMRITVKTCFRCHKMLGIVPGGVVHDPQRSEDSSKDLD